MLFNVLTCCGWNSFFSFLYFWLLCVEGKSFNCDNGSFQFMFLLWYYSLGFLAIEGKIPFAKTTINKRKKSHWDSYKIFMFCVVIFMITLNVIL